MQVSKSKPELSSPKAFHRYFNFMKNEEFFKSLSKLRESLLIEVGNLEDYPSIDMMLGYKKRIKDKVMDIMQGLEGCECWWNGIMERFEVDLIRNDKLDVFRLYIHVSYCYPRRRSALVLERFYNKRLWYDVIGAGATKPKEILNIVSEPALV